MLLQFQALLATAIGILLARADSRVWEKTPFLWAVGLLGAFWFSATLLCLFGVSRLEWGDLGEGLDVATQTEINDAEQKYVRTLICEVIRRSAKFRVATWLTVWSVALFFGMCICVTFLLVQAGETAAFPGAGHSLLRF
jgi:hypothetical protein